MPNWCMTLVNIKGDDERKLDELADRFEEALKSRYIVTDFGDNWLGNIVFYLEGDEYLPREGETTEHNQRAETFINTQPMRCRGEVCYIDRDKGELRMDIESAWGPHIEPIKAMVDKYYPEAKVYYYAEECGNALYMSNYESDKDCYIFDFCDEKGLPDELNFECREPQSMNYVATALRKVLGIPATDTAHSIDDLVEMCNEKYADYGGIHKIEFCEIEDIYKGD